MLPFCLWIRQIEFMEAGVIVPIQRITNEKQKYEYEHAIMAQNTEAND